MILLENRNYLRLKNRNLLEELKILEEAEDEKKVFVESTKSSERTIKISLGGKTQYLHSKYNPNMEADKLIGRIGGLEKYKHVLFIGVGLGYHIKSFIKSYPDKSFSIFEPNKEVLLKFLSESLLSEFPYKHVHSIFTEVEEQDIRTNLVELFNTVKGNIYSIPLPAYENLYPKEITIVREALKEIYTEKKSSFSINTAFQKRWTLNAVKNFPYVMKTPNILHHIDRSNFQGKTAIIVAAGPSLSNEIETLRHIKKNKLAYIFSVGSAINALIENGIYPDAACTYDPTNLNYLVMEKLKKKGISNVPLIFGSTVGYETLENYPGPMLHMIINQDTVSPQLLNTTEEIDIVLDAPSITVITFQMLKLLGFRRIILVGQDLSYQNNNRYASGINYDYISNEISDEEIKTSIMVKSVDGGLVHTNETFNRMRLQLEYYIRVYNDLTVINTTQFGAYIEGTYNTSLSKVVEELNGTSGVNEDWYKTKKMYDFNFVQEQYDRIIHLQDKCEKSLQTAINTLKEIEYSINKGRVSNLEKNLIKFEKEFNYLKENLFYVGFIEPMIRVQNKILSDESYTIRYENDLDKKGRSVIQHFGAYLIQCGAHINFIKPYLQEISEKIRE